jgi:diacylglycerol kinase family enzyme
MQIGVITNPNSRKNRGRPDRAAELQSIVGDLGEVHQTANVDGIKPIVREFLRRRARFWVADGGDGALHYMIKAGLEVLEEEEFNSGDYALPLTVPTNGGTIDFVAHNVGIRGRAEEILGALRGALETGKRIEEVEVDSMLVEGVEVTDSGTESFRTFGFASAVGGIGQRFYSKYYADEDPNPKTIMKVIGTTLASMPVALSPLRQIPALPRALREYAREMFEPCRAQVTVDGMILPHNDYRGIHIASMSINLGGVFHFFPRADEPGQMQCLVGAPNPFVIAWNLPAMHLGKPIRGDKIVDRPCRTMIVEATGEELLAPIIDGEYYQNVKSVTFKVGPRVRIPKVVGRAAK